MVAAIKKKAIELKIMKALGITVEIQKNLGIPVEGLEDEFDEQVVK